MVGKGEEAVKEARLTGVVNTKLECRNDSVKY